MMTVTLLCDNCGEKFEQTIEYISDVEWVCPKCKYTDIALLDIDDPDKDDSPLVMGRGGCRQK